MSDSTMIGILLVPSVAALLLLIVFSYLYRQSRQSYFRAWQLGWAFYCGYLAMAWLSLTPEGPATVFLRLLIGKLFFLGMVMAILVSTRLVRGRTKREWYDIPIVVVAAVWAAAVSLAHARESDALLHLRSFTVPFIEVDVFFALLLVLCGFLFYRHAAQRSSLAYRALAIAIVVWAVLLSSRQLHGYFDSISNIGHFLGPLPQMLIGIAMVMVLYEEERRTVQDNLLAFSTLDVDTSRLLDPEELLPSLERMVDRLGTLMRMEQGALCIGSGFRGILPSCFRGFSDELLEQLRRVNAPESLESVVYRRGGLAIFRDPDDLISALPSVSMDARERLLETFERDGITSLIAVSVQSATRSIGVLLFPQKDHGQQLGSLQLKILMGLAMQIGMTLDNYLLMHDAQRRTKEYELLTQIGQVVSSRLDPDEVLRSIHRELGQLFNNANFYVAFVDEKEVRYELEVEEGNVLPKRVRQPVNGIAEHIVRSGKPLLARAGMEALRASLGIVPTGRASKCYCGVPIFFYGKPTGVMAVHSYDQEYVFEQRDLEIMDTAAGQLAVAIENARLFSEEQRRSRYLGFLNTISTAAISSQDADQMLAGIVAEIQKNFNFDHIGIGLVEYATKEIEIKAEAGATAKTLGKKIPLGVGIIGRVARSGDMALVQNPGENLLGILHESRSVLCIPINYGESMLGVLNVESTRVAAFSPQDVLILRTLADLLATALHNAFVFQKMQQQAITDGLTGIKTRRYFLEAVSAEWKRASRSGRPFSVVLIDLDKFKEVNDVHGHLEGDLVLARVGRLLEQKCRQSNVVSRYGGDEFVILMPETSVEQAQILSERLRLWIATDPMLNERRVTGSFGVATFPVHGSTFEDIIRVADAGMYVSKHAGGNRVSTAHELVEVDTTSHEQVVHSYVEGFLQREQTGMESADELVGKLRRLSENLRSGSAQQVMMEAVHMLNRAAETRESRSTGHGDLVAKYTEMIARALMLAEDEINDVVFAARVHDVGKIIIPERILNKPDQLTPEEYELMKMHATVGGEIVGAIPGSSRLRRTIRYHHERFDGSGYPDGLHGEEIPVTARILAVADSFSEMIAEKPFGLVLTQEQALNELERLSGTRYDGMIVRLLVRELRSERAAKQNA